MRRWGTATKWLISTLIIAAQPRAFGHFDTLRPLWTRIARRLTYPPSHACTGRPSRLPRAHLPGGAGSRRPARLARVHRLRDRRGEGCKLSVTVVTRHDVACQDEPVVVRALAFVVVQRVVGLVGLGPSSDDKDVEIAVLRHQLLVLRRRVARPVTHRPTARCSRALAKVLPRHRWPIFLLTPSTLLRCIRSWCGAGGPNPIPAGVHHALCVRTWSRSWFGWPGRNPLGIPAHRRRVPQTRHPRFGDIVAHDPASARSLAGTAARRAELDPVPAHPGCRGARV